MMPTSKKGISKGAVALLAFAAVTATLVLIIIADGNDAMSLLSENTSKTRIGTRSKSRTLSADEKQQKQIKANEAVDNEKNEATYIAEVPVDIRESMDPQTINFVVAGFQKCGTTYLQNKILYPSKRLFIPHHETHYLQNDKYAEFAAEFENVTKSSTEDKVLVSGYKAPFELGHQHSLRNLETLFPDVRMIITLRHPVLQFESLYNYKLRSLSYLIPPVEEFVGACGELCPKHNDNGSNIKKAKGKGQSCLTKVPWCTGESNYHQYLSRLGLTPMNTPEELDLLDHHDMSIHDFSGGSNNNNNKNKNDNKGSNIRDGSGGGDHHHDDDDTAKIFLIEIGQFDNRVDQSMADDVASNLETFLGLDVGDLPRAPPRAGDKKPKPKYKYPPGREEQILDICLDRYEPLREVLLETSRKASKWIMEYMLHPSNRQRVIVSNIDIFERMVEEWKTDPCLNEEVNSI